MSAKSSILGITPRHGISTVLSTPHPIGGHTGKTKENPKMMNLVEKFNTEAVEATDEDGIVAIEYVVMAGVVITAVGALVFTGAFSALTTKLTSLINSI